YLRVHLGIEPVCLVDRRLEVVEHYTLGNATERPEGIFQTADKSLGGLLVDDLAVGLARMAQNHAKDMRAPTLAIDHDRRSRAEIDLDRLPGSAFQTTERQRCRRTQSVHETTDAVVTAREPVFRAQVLEDTLGGSDPGPACLERFTVT